ncbi:MAG: hypothetical protein E4H27_03240, partial [Anaerolineales bacterium]
MAGMKRYMLSRLATMIPVILGVTLIVFSMLHLTPGDPVKLIVGPRADNQLDRIAWCEMQHGKYNQCHA